MKIVINLNYETYKRVMASPKKYALNGVDFIGIEKDIKNGTTLPKHHGRLIDADALMKAYSQFEFSSDMGDAMEILDHAPTIIEADTEGSEGDK